ncbi:tRNA (cytosine(34)-C(5))-methyltransferase-like isoform X2 [Penaeus japonicus]|uniref:tRNA (cytosine(34)-C(5))-methyltransferase-like isoform X2 n=1 Tax=Penaeus japonicus TaxID=27405 RepID=UPI001C713E3F|nr:tRNA (cytosine(34)-C(5))-methyltransferase-like isoform X2 [Penaeus japonicus]
MLIQKSFCSRATLHRNFSLHFLLRCDSLLQTDMGKKGKKFKKRVDQPKKERPQHTNYAELVRENKDFETYYKAQKVVPEEEWDEFLACMKTNLPAAFRLTGSKSMARALLKVLTKTFFEPLSQLVPPELSEEEIKAGEEPVKPLRPLCLPWYPDNLAWQLNLTRRNIRRCEAYWQLHQCLISETETGNISRQEAVSMIPPLVLNIEPHHKILDMCAAPGSKTAQLIEFLHSSDDELGAAIPQGIVVANDVDNRRCYMLTHQAKRLQSPSIIITNHDAAFMPKIYHTRKDGSVGPLKYDRILCDVPCSGDGTLRKNFDVWAKWNPANGANLHGLQLRIARRGLEMLEVGGRMVYSTCSLNPLENEAVIQRLLIEGSGSIRLLDVTEQLPGLKFIPGLEEWTLMNREMEVIKTVADIPLKNTNLFNKHLFPPAPEDREKLNLRRCIRIMPHQQDTGGFFVAVLEKVKPLPGEKVYKPSDQTEQKDEAHKTQRIKEPPKKKRRQGFKEAPYYYFEDDEAVWPGINDFYAIREEIGPGLFLSRTKEGKKRNLYFTNSLVKDIVNLNQEDIKIINTGVKVLVRSDNKGTPCDFRLAQDGSAVLLPLITKRKITVTKEDLVIMLQNDDMEMPPEITTLDPKTQEQCTELCTGAIAFLFKDEDLTIELVGWKGNRSVRAYVAKHDRLHYLRLLGADTSKYEKNKFQEQRDLDAKSAASENNGEMSVGDDNSDAIEMVNDESTKENSNGENVSDTNGENVIVAEEK